jgi:hypothetical protein
MAPNTETAVAVTATEDRIQSTTSSSYKIRKATEKRETTNNSLVMHTRVVSLDSSTPTLFRKAAASASSNETVSKKNKKMYKETEHRQLSRTSLPSCSSTWSWVGCDTSQRPVSLTTAAASKSLKEDHTIETNCCLITKKRKKKKQQSDRSTPVTMLSQQAGRMTKKMRQQQQLSSLSLSNAKTTRTKTRVEQRVMMLLQQKKTLLYATKERIKTRRHQSRVAKRRLLALNTSGLVSKTKKYGSN